MACVDNVNVTSHTSDPHSPDCEPYGVTLIVKFVRIDCCAARAWCGSHRSKCGGRRSRAERSIMKAWPVTGRGRSLVLRIQSDCSDP